MKVENVIFYQVATDRNYKVGDIIEFGKDYNYQAHRVFTGDLITRNETLENAGKSLLKNNKYLLNLTKQLTESLSEYDFIVRELAMEKVRQDNFSQMPSRLKCMFVINDKDAVLNGMKTFYQKGHGNIFQAVAVKLTGNIFYANSFAIGRLGKSYQEYKDLAQKYWSQNQNKNKECLEILFEGKAEIVEILDTFKHKN